jgi:NAD(P)-dependent dehydrogenase (short-subunit alcohol dehydrogenase family)
MVRSAAFLRHSFQQRRDRRSRSRYSSRIRHFKLEQGDLSKFAGRVLLRPRGAAKGAIVNLTRELALQYAEKNIQVNAICPGFFRTKLGPFDDEAFVAAVTNFTPMKRIAEPDEIKGTALYLASSASNFVTGAMLVIDGGCMAK